MTIDEQILWRRVEEALDARRDPFADPVLARDLARAPELRAATERLVARLAALDGAQRATEAPRPFPVRRTAALAASIALLAGGLAAVFVARGASEHDTFAGAHVYESHVRVVRAVPAEPRAARVVHVPERIVAWQVAGRTRP